MSLGNFIYFIIAGVLGGLLSSVAGLASLASYPALLLAGIPPVVANVTNTASLIFAGIGATLSSRKELRGEGRMMALLLAIALSGGIFGSFLLLVESPKTFEHIVPFFILLSGILLLISRRNGTGKQMPPLASQNKGLLLLKGVGVFVIGAYTGYFGAAGGVMMLALLSISLPQRFSVLNAFKNVMAFAANLIAAVVFALNGKVDWPIVLPLGLGFLIGGYCGPIIVRHAPVKTLRILIAFGAFILAGYLFFAAF